MRLPLTRAIAAASAIFFVANSSSVLAQIDRRINNRVRGMGGRALDRNPLLGSGGVNSPGARYSFDGGFRARSLITGNLTGLAAFHGQTQILQSNSFRGALPSAGLSSFTARSVGLGQVRSRRALAPTSYLGIQETIPNLGFIRRGLNRPGSSLLISPLTRQPKATVREARSTLLDIRSPAASIVGVRPDLSTYGTRQRPLAPMSDTTARGLGTLGGLDAPTPGLSFPMPTSSASPFGFAADSSIFGSPLPAAFRSPSTGEGISSATRLSIEAALRSRTLDRPIDLRQAAPGEDPRGGTLAGGGAALDGGRGVLAGDGRPLVRPGGALDRARLPGGRLDDPRTAGVDLTGRLGGSRGAGVRDTGAEERALFTARGQRPLSATTGLVTGLERDSRQGAAGFAARPANLGADKFADIISAVGALQASGASRLGFLARAGMAEDGSIAQDFRAASERGEAVAPGVQPPSDALARPGDVRESATAVRWADKLLDDPITSFVGMYRGRLNDFMLRAEEALHGGKFYDAARLFDLAHTIETSNPLPLLGRGHALIAAGDYMSGEIALERGISRFPQIVAFRLDLPSLVGADDTYDLRRLDLEKRLALRDHYRLRFVLGYLELYSGLPEQGLRNLRRAADLAPAESVVALFPDLLLGTRALPPVGRRHR